jgi:hypothetical protein
MYGITLKSSHPVSLGSIKHHMVKLTLTYQIHLVTISLIQKFATDACITQLFLNHCNDEL